VIERHDRIPLRRICRLIDILKDGPSVVIVHVHDILFPDDYPDTWLKKNRFFWNEQYMLQAFLSMNPNFTGSRYQKASASR
jgi:hypothetical protein